MRYSMAAALVALAAISTPVMAHSWIEQLMNIDPKTMTFTGKPGFIRGWVDRKMPDFKDTRLVHILPPSDPLEARDVSTQGISPKDSMCRISQKKQVQTPGFDRLKTAPGGYIALRYMENGHVTLPGNSLRKPENRGTVYIYGTTSPKESENFLDIFKRWTKDGKGGDGRGRLLATQDYDDKVCYQVNGQTMSTQRQKQYPHKADPQMGGDLWCQNDVQLPDDAPVGKPYTIYWVWDWPTLPGGPNDPTPNGKAELYTSCMDVDIIKPGAKARSLEVRDGQVDLNKAAIPGYMKALSKPSANSGTQAHEAPAQPPKASTTQPAPSQPAPSQPSPKPAANQPPAVNPQPQPQGTKAGAQAAADVVLEALGPQLVSELASKLTAKYTTTKTAAASAMTSQAQATPQKQINSPSPKIITNTLTKTRTNINTVVANSMPTSLQYAPPMLNPSQLASTATPASAAPSNPQAGGCTACQKLKRSRIFSG